jgi:4-alpha-glucanotransferase
MSTPTATLLPLTSLKNFTAALTFLRWLKQTGQTGWQMLPISDPIATPYRGQGIGWSSHFYDPHVPSDYRHWLLDRIQFIAANQDWLLNYALFQTLSAHFHTSKWWTWPAELAHFQADAIAASRLKFAATISGYIDEQCFLANQFTWLKRLAHEHEVMLLGDLPFYLALDSALVWSHQDLFLLSANGQLQWQSGVPASDHDQFGAQLWGHPLYNWQEADLARIMDLFTQRLKFLANFFDLVRLDHANGFFKYGLMSASHPSWSRKVAGPGKDALLHLLPQLQTLDLGIYVEDIASDRMRLEQFMKEYHIAGMGVLTLLHNLEMAASPARTPSLDLAQFSGNKVVFTSTHDTPPLITWVKALPPPVRQQLTLANHLDAGITDKGLAVALREQILSLDARLIIVPWQDWQLDNFRFNVPGREDLTNWHYPVAINKYIDPIK